MNRPPSPVSVWRDEDGVMWILVVCPYCQADLSKTSQGREVKNPFGEVLTTETFHPLRCPECNHPLLPSKRQAAGN